MHPVELLLTKLCVCIYICICVFVFVKMTRWRQLPSPHAPCWAIIDHAGRGWGGVVRSLATEVRSMWRGKGPHCLDPKVCFIPFWSWTTGETDWFQLFSEKEIATCKLVQNSKRSSPLDSATKYASWLRAFFEPIVKYDQGLVLGLCWASFYVFYCYLPPLVLSRFLFGPLGQLPLFSIFNLVLQTKTFGTSSGKAIIPTRN